MVDGSWFQNIGLDLFTIALALLGHQQLKQYLEREYEVSNSGLGATLLSVSGILMMVGSEIPSGYGGVWIYVSPLIAIAIGVSIFMAWISITKSLL